MARRLRAGCPHREYKRFATTRWEPQRPAYCPCAWTEWTLGKHLAAMAAWHPDLARLLRSLDTLFPEPPPSGR